MESLTKTFLLISTFSIEYGIWGYIKNQINMRCIAVLLAAFSFSPATAQTVTIAALGDSLTQGYGLPQEDGLTAQLQQWLDARALDVEILNAGVSGDTTSGGLQRTQWTLTPDVDAMIVTLGGNDMLRGIAPSLSRENLDNILQITQAQNIPTLLVGITAPSNFGATYKAEFDAIYPELAAKYESLFFPNIFAPLLALGPWPQVLSTHMQSDGIHPNTQGVAVIVEHLGPKVIELTQNAAQN